MANEVDTARGRGTLQPHGDVRTSDIAKLDDLGLDRRRVSEWRDVRDAIASEYGRPCVWRAFSGGGRYLRGDAPARAVGVAARYPEAEKRRGD